MTPRSILSDLLSWLFTPIIEQHVYPWQAVRGFMLLGGVIAICTIIIWVM